LRRSWRWPPSFTSAGPHSGCTWRVDVVTTCGLIPDLFPGWALSQRQALEQAGISPPTIDLADTDLTATRWAEQKDIDWILLIPSLAAAHTTTVIRPTSPAQLVPFTLQWNPNRAHTMAVARFVHAALTAELPPGWHTQRIICTITPAWRRSVRVRG
jgi:hypothetical protein